jgi:hypothetical protein
LKAPDPKDLAERLRNIEEILSLKEYQEVAAAYEKARSRVALDIRIGTASMTVRRPF